jgi:DNA polymerase V
LLCNFVKIVLSMVLKRIKKSQVLDFYIADFTQPLNVHFSKNEISAGFPSPAEDYMELKIDLNSELISNPNATFFARVKGSSMIEAGIQDGDILVIDKSKEPQNKAIAVCYIDGEFTVKEIKIEKKACYLMPANPEYKPIKVTEENEFIIWGIVTFVIHKV